MKPNETFQIKIDQSKKLQININTLDQKQGGGYTLGTNFGKVQQGFKNLRNSKISKTLVT